MRLDTIIIMPPYAASAAAAAAILDNAMGVVHFGQAREEADDGSRRRQWAAMELTSFFAVNYYRRRERGVGRAKAECALLRAQIDRLGRF